MPWVRLAASCDAPLVFRKREERARGGERETEGERGREGGRARGCVCVREICLVTRTTGHAVEAFERERRERVYRESTPNTATLRR